jgi:MYXO-CTERM domain-containing protein
MKGSPLVFSLDASCNVVEDPEGPAASAAHTRPAGAQHGSRSPRSGCCGANAAPESPLAMAVVVVGVLVRRRRR